MIDEWEAVVRSSPSVPSSSLIVPNSSFREWEWDPSHHPLPLTPAFGSVYPRWVERAMAVTFAEFGMLPRGIEVRQRDGYPFYRVRPPGVDRVPPAWLVPMMLRLWWLHPESSRRVRTAMRRVRADHSTTILRRWETRWRPAILREQAGFRAALSAGPGDADLAALIDRLARRTELWVTVHFLLHGAISLPVMRLERFLRGAPAARSVRIGDLLLGSSRASSEPARALGRVAESLRGRPDLLHRVERLPPDEALTALRDGSAEFAERLDAFLGRHGQGIFGRYEFIVPTLSEQPASLTPAILRLARSPIAVDRDDGAAQRVAEETAAQLRDPEAERRLRGLVSVARRAYAVRDDNVTITFTDAFGLNRQALLAAADRLARRGALSAREDVFFLSVAETVAALRGTVTPSGETIEERRSAWEAAIVRPPQRGLSRRLAVTGFAGLPPEAREVNEGFLRYIREIMAAPDVSAVAMSSPVEVRGIGAVRGRYRGVARVLRGQEDFDRLAPGEVLVCPMTSPSWAAVLPLAGALVTDHGGVLSHPAVIAREFGIPAVVATGDATRRIADGATVEVDGDAGVVRVVT